ncbi:MAG TPA: response regulator transcription factor [Pseudonocardiaceae bacterium]
MTSVLVVDDDPMISRFVERGLSSAGYTTAVAADATSGLVLARSGAFDLVLLDLVLGDGDGFTVLRELRRQRTGLPVVVMTGHPAHRDVVACLDGGADDYLVKPFRFEELLARVRARLRRDDAPAASTLTAGDLSLDLLTRRVTAGTVPVDLTVREFALLETFLRHPDQVLSRTQLLSRVWGYTFDPGSNVVNVYINTLRQKIGTDRIQTVRGAGYRLRAVRTAQRAAEEPPPASARPTPMGSPAIPWPA